MVELIQNVSIEDVGGGDLSKHFTVQCQVIMFILLSGAHC